MTYLLVVLLLGLLILVHEAGHLAAARAVGIPVARFSVGFGRALWKRKLGNTEYRLSLVPLGGYVLPDLADKNEYFQIPVHKRIILALGGPAANTLAAPVLLALANLVHSGPSMAGLVTAPFTQTASLFHQVLSAIPIIFSHPGEMAGLVGIVAQGGEIVGTNLAMALALGAFLSINLAVFNLLPLPVLDGGKIVLCLMEKIHPCITRLHIPLNIAGLILILGLMVYVTVLDIGRLFA